MYSQPQHNSQAKLIIKIILIKYHQETNQCSQHMIKYPINAQVTFYIQFYKTMSNRQPINQSIVDQSLEEELKNSRALKESVISHFDHSTFSVMNLADNPQTVVFQFIATFLFTYGYSCSISTNQIDAQAAGCLLMAIFFSGPLCGANINPVITISNCLKKENKYKSSKIGWYIIAQILGSVAAISWSCLLGHKQFSALVIDENSNLLKIVANESVGIFILILFLLLISNPNTTFIESELSGYLSIAIFYHIARSFAPLAGLVINPAITIVVAFQYALQGQLDSLANLWAWLLGDLLGCIAAILFYDRIYQPTIGQLRQIRRNEQNKDSLMSRSLLQS